MEDPEKILKQSLEEMQRDLEKVKAGYSESVANLRRTEGEKAKMEKSVEEWTRRAEMALKSGDENLAREALSVKKEKEIQTAKLTEQVQMLSEASEKFQSSLKLYQSKIEEAKGETASYASRALAAKTVKTVNEMASGVGESSAATFEKMKEKVEAMEINAEVTAESLPAGADPGLNAKFRALESDDVDDELEKMKRRLEAGQ